MQFRIPAIVFVAALSVAVLAQRGLVCPEIKGISHLAIYTSNPAAAEHYYSGILGAAKDTDPENPKGVRYVFGPDQFIEVLPLPPNSGINRMDHAAFNTGDAEGLRTYLAAKGWKTPDKVTKGSDGSTWFFVLDPEGNNIQFITPGPQLQTADAPHAIGHHIIHVGFVVHDRAKEDTFYRDLLGFRPYWFGGMQDDKIDWVSQEVPNGNDWLEYMITSGPSGSGIPPNMSQQQLGVLDHFSIGEKSVPETYKVLASANRLDCKHDTAPKIGRDGKYQFNMYDPDGIRTEIMNFHATDKPCCSQFTAMDPAQ